MIKKAIELSLLDESSWEVKVKEIEKDKEEEIFWNTKAMGFFKFDPNAV